MRVNTKYRTVILQAYPDSKQEKILERCEQSVLKFLEVSRIELQKMLYHGLKGQVEISARTVVLLAQRFTGSMGEKAFLPFDKDNSKFVREGGIWLIEAQLLKGRGQRVKIPISRTELPYYESIEDLVRFPFFLVQENKKWFAYVSIPVKEDNGTGITVGIDFNLRKWVAAPYEGSPLFFDARSYSDRVDRLQRLIARAQRTEEGVGKYYTSLRGLIKQAHGNFLGLIVEKWGICTLALEDIEVMYGMRGLKSKLTNNWLYKKTALRQLALRAMAKGFEVMEVPPRGTSHLCHRCGSPLKIYGRHERLVECSCGLRDYNRDLNAARNIARRVKEIWQSPGLGLGI